MELFPVFFSPKFWGIVVTVVAFQLSDMNFISPELFEYIYQIAGPATVVGVVDSAARKISV